MPKKIRRGVPLDTTGFVCLFEKVKNERWDPMDPLPWPDLALDGFRIVSKKWTDQCEDCSLKKKKGHCYSRAFFLKRIKRRLKTCRNVQQVDPNQPSFQVLVYKFQDLPQAR